MRERAERIEAGGDQIHCRSCPSEHSLEHDEQNREQNDEAGRLRCPPAMQRAAQRGESAFGGRVLHGRAGTFNFVHSATTTGSDRSAEFFTVVPSSGTGELTGISGTGGLSIDADGTHRIWFDTKHAPS